TAIAYLHQALAMAQAVGDRFSEGTALGNLAATYQAMAQPETAVQYAQQHLEIALEIGDRAGEVRAREILGKAEIRKL
ncbi:MAG: tetratricopeptide repeat protein, partial [Cyanobacteria bacterium J06639_14]